MAVQICHPLIHNCTQHQPVVPLLLHYFQFLELFKKVIYIYLNLVPLDCQSQRQNIKSQSTNLLHKK